MKIGVVGASGYAGGELLRLLAHHPKFETSYISAGTNAGEKVTSVHSHLTTYVGRRFSETNTDEISELDLVFLALPHGESKKIVESIKPSTKIVDLGADFRLSDEQSWLRYYGGDYAGKWIYGLPELPGQREKIKSATRIANPGCYATAITLAIAPALQKGHIESSDIVAVAASGTTGAGRSNKVALSASEIMNSLTSYKFGGVHQHIPEIEENLQAISADKVKVSFTPILAPMPRGILATVTAKCDENIETIQKVYEDLYQDESFIKVLPAGMMPETSSLTGSNSVHIQVAIDVNTSRLVVSAAIDNLGKGAAGQAIQNANLIAGLPEGCGLSTMGLGQ